MKPTTVANRYMSIPTHIQQIKIQPYIIIPGYAVCVYLHIYVKEASINALSQREDQTIEYVMTGI